MPAKGSTTRVPVKCLICGKEENVIPARAKTYKTCSRSCMGARASVMLANKIVMACNVCGTEYESKPSGAHRRRTCSKMCLAELKREQMAGAGNHQYGRRGAERGAAFKTGRSVTAYGYVVVLVDTRYVFEHRHLMEIHIGRKLFPEEVVHHKNHNRQDNRIENLEIMRRSDHTTYHNLKDRQPRDGITGRYISRKTISQRSHDAIA